MGMFDYVNFSVDCPNCGKKVDGFQSKDGKCELEKIPYWKVRYFYSPCDNCEAWINFSLKENAEPYIPIENYEMTVKLNRGGKQ